MLSCCLLMLSTGCGFADKAAINKVLDQRDAAMSARDTQALAALLVDDFTSDGLSKAQKLEQIKTFLDTFDQVDMHSHDRVISLHSPFAECEQNYSLRVQQGGEWRSVVQRERVILKHTASGWKISGGI